MVSKVVAPCAAHRARLVSASVWLQSALILLIEIGTQLSDQARAFIEIQLSEKEVGVSAVWQSLVLETANHGHGSVASETCGSAAVAVVSFPPAPALGFEHRP